MATYKIPQNVEAEDKLIGPFSFKQFIFLMVAAMAIFLAYGLSKINIFLVAIPLPIIISFLILGLYHREDQPVETYLLAAINFYIKPRKRVWNMEGQTELVRITAPKTIAPPAPHNYQQDKGQLERLAHIVDTRGWYAKRPELQEPIAEPQALYDDRLVAPIAVQRPEPIDVHASDDILDPYNNPRADDFDQLANKTYEQNKAGAIASMQTALAQPQPAAAPAPTQAPQKAQPKPAPQPAPKTAPAPSPASTKPAASAAKPKKVEPLVEPSNLHYNPYPSMHMHVLDPKSGKIAMEDTDDLAEASSSKPKQAVKDLGDVSVNEMTSKPATDILKSASQELKISQLATAIDRQQMQAGQEINLHPNATPNAPSSNQPTAGS